MKAAKAYTEALNVADVFLNSVPDCLIIVSPGPCERSSTYASWMRAEHLTWAASADATTEFIRQLEAIRWPLDVEEDAAALVRTLKKERKLMVAAAEANKAHIHDAVMNAFFGTFEPQSMADALRKWLGLKPIKRPYGLSYQTNAY